VSFNVTANAYARFMGQFSEPLADRFADLAEVQPGQRALDVGCGPGVLTAQLVNRLGVDAVCAVDPSAPFVDAVRSRIPGIDVRVGVAENLAYPNDSFDAALAQLVVHFMKDSTAGLSEMARVTRPGGVVAACVWDHYGGGSPLTTFWTAVHELDPAATGESQLAGAREGQLAQLSEAAGLHEIQSSSLTVTVGFATFTDWWEPYTLGVGPAGAYVASLDDARRRLLRDRCQSLLPSPPFEVAASAWCVKARA
jgi:SAM-dependent methyltransferase